MSQLSRILDPPQVVKSTTVSLAVLDESFYTSASPPTHLNSTGTVQWAESSAAIVPPPAAKNKGKEKKSRVPSVEPEKEVEDYCVPQLFLEFVAALKPPKEEAMEIDDNVTDPSQKTRCWALQYDDDPAWAKSLIVGQEFVPD